MVKNIIVNPENYRKFLRYRAAANALNKRAESLKAEFNLPEASKQTVGEYILQDGNQQAIGKVTISARDGYTVKPGFTCRIS
jgi:hypothetical protein